MNDILMSQVHAYAYFYSKGQWLIIRSHLQLFQGECYIQNYPISKQFQPTPIIDLQIMALASKSLANADNLSIYTSQSKLYHFPDITVLGKEFNTAQEVSYKLDLLLKNYNNINESSKIQKSFIMREAEGGMLFKCRVRGCLAFLKFNYTAAGRLILAKSDIEHQHKMCPRMKGRVPKIRSSQIEECFDQLQLLNFKPGQIASFIRQRFRISKPHFYAIKYQRKRRDNIKALLMALSKFDNFFFQCRDLQQLASHYRNQDPTPPTKLDQDVVIVVSRKMKQLYEQYHCNYVVFSIFPDLVLQTRYAKKLKYHHMCLLYGEDSTCQLNLLFGVVIMRRPARLAYLYVMEKLFTFLGKYPKVLISDYDPNLAQAVRRLQRRSENPLNCIKLHIQLPNSFISNTLQGRTSSQFISIISNDLQGLLRQPDRHKHQQRFRQIIKACQLNPPNTQAHIIDIVTKYVTNNSIVNLPPYFIGLTMMPYSVATELRSRVLDFFKSPRPMVLALKAFFQIFEAYPVLKFLSKDQIKDRLSSPKQHYSKKQKLHLLATIGKTYEPTTRLRTATKALAHPVALCFADSMQKCFHGRLQMKKSRNTYFKVGQTKSHYSYQVNIANQVRRGQVVKVYRCTCQYYAKIGLPCWHQIKACIQQRSSIINQINPFWLKKLKFVQTNKESTNEHDIKLWNDEQLTKLAESEERELMADVTSVVQSVIGMDEVKKPDGPGEYNIKINSNPSNIPGYSDIDFNRDSSQAGLFDLINQLQGVDWTRQDDDNITNHWQDNASSKVSEHSQRGYTSNPYTPYSPNIHNYQNRSVMSHHSDTYVQPSYLSPTPTYHFPLPYHTEQDELNMDFQMDNYEQQDLNSLSMYLNQPSQMDYMGSKHGSKRGFQYQQKPYSQKPKCYNFFDDEDEDDIDDQVDDQGDQQQQQVVQDNRSDNDSNDDWERRSLTKIMVRTNGRGEIEDDQVVEVEHPKKKKDRELSRSGNDSSKSGRSQVNQIRGRGAVRSINKSTNSINLIDNDAQF